MTIQTESDRRKNTSVLERVIFCIQGTMKYEPHVVVDETKLLHDDLGMDALDMDDLITDLEIEFDASFGVTSTYDGYTVGQLASYVQTQIQQQEDDAEVSVDSGTVSWMLTVSGDKYEALDNLSRSTGMCIDQHVNNAISAYLLNLTQQRNQP